MTARALEAAGIATVIIGSALDIVSWCSVPRYLHNNLPLGNPLGEPSDRQTQRASVERALSMVETMREPGAEISDMTWSGDPEWHSVYARVTPENRAELLRMGDENRRQRAENKAKGLAR